MLFPTLAIVEVRDQVVMTKLASLTTANCLIFVSPNAVWHGVPLVNSHAAWPKLATIAAVGGSTATVLEEHGLTVDCVPSGTAGAAALLDLPVFHSSQINRSRVFIFKGRGGLTILTDELVQRGAEVVELDVYQRRKPQVDASEFVAEALGGGIDLVVVSSGEALVNLFDMLGARGRPWLCGADLLVVSERIADIAQELGVRRRPRVAAGAAPSQVVDELKRWKETRHD